MCDNEYVARVMVKERIRDAEARGAFNAMVRERGLRTDGLGVSARPRRHGWMSAWWHTAPAWLAHLALPKTWNRL
jgi:hypothetical protein